MYVVYTLAQINKILSFLSIVEFDMKCFGKMKALYL